MEQVTEILEWAVENKPLLIAVGAIVLGAIERWLSERKKRPAIEAPVKAIEDVDTPYMAGEVRAAMPDRDDDRDDLKSILSVVSLILKKQADDYAGKRGRKLLDKTVDRLGFKNNKEG